MSYHERKSVAMMVTTIIVFAVYALVLFGKYKNGDFADVDPLRLGAILLLLTIPIEIGSKIITMILFSIGRAIATRGEEVDIPIEDERDKMIELKAARIAAIVFGAGFFLAMGALALAWPLAVSFLILFAGVFACDISTEIAQFRYYRRGL
jgi:uncharacterized membrane protein